MRAGIGLHYLDLAHYQGGGGAFEPSSLFGDTDTGGFYDPSDLTSMFVERTSPSTLAEVGDPVGYMIDKSQLGGMSVAAYMDANSISDPTTIPGNHLVSDDDDHRPILRDEIVDGTDVDVSGQTELVSNPGPDFTATTGWSTASGDGVLSVVNGELFVSQTTSSQYSTPISVTANAWYLIEFEVGTEGISSWSGNYFGPNATTSGAWEQSFGSLFSGERSTVLLRAQADGTAYVGFRRNSSTTSSLAEWSVKEVPATASRRYYLDFDGTDDIMIASAAPFSAGENGTAYVALDAPNADNDYVFAMGNSGAADPYTGLIIANNSASADEYLGAVINSTAGSALIAATVERGVAFDDSPHVAGYLQQDDAVASRVDSAQSNFESYTTAAQALDQMSLGGLARTTNSNYCDCNVYGAIIIDRTLTTLERQNLEIFLANKSGATLDSSSTATFPALLYDANTDGGWYDPSDLTSLVRYALGVSTSVDLDEFDNTSVSVGDTIGTILDKSQLGGQTLQAYVQDPANNIIGTEATVAVVDNGGTAGSLVEDSPGVYTLTDSSGAGQSSYPRFEWRNILTNGQIYYFEWTVTVNSGVETWLSQARANTSGSTSYIFQRTGGSSTVPSGTVIKGFALAGSSGELQMSGSTTNGDINVTLSDMKVVPIPGNHLVSDNDDHRPILRDEDVDSPATTRKRYYLEFDGTDDLLTGDSGFDGDINGVSISSGTAAAQSTATDDYTAVLSSTSDTDPIFSMFASDDSDDDAFRVVRIQDDGTSDADDTVTSIVIDGTTVVVTNLHDEGAPSDTTYANGTSENATSDGIDGTTTIDNFALGGLGQGTPANFAETNVYGHMHANRLLTYSEREELEAYLGRKSGTIDFDTAWHPSSLFENSEDGAVYDVSDLTSMFVEIDADFIDTGNPSVGDAVGVILDKSQMGGMTAGAYFSSLDANLATNGGFDTDTAWTKGSGWTISGGTANTDGTTASIFQSPGTSDGEFYLIRFDITSVTTTGSGIRVRAGTGDWSDYKNAVGSYEVVRISNATDRIELQSVGFEGSIDNVEIHLIGGNHAVAPSDAARPVLQRDSNGKLYLDHDGVDDTIAVTTTIFGSGNYPLTYAVSGTIEDAADQYLFGISSTFRTTLRHDGSDLVEVRDSADTAYSDIADGASWTTLVPYVLSYERTSATTARAAANGSGWPAPVTVYDATAQNYGFYLGVNAISSGYVDVAIYAGVAIDRALTGTERDRLERWLADKAGINLKQ